MKINNSFKKILIFIITIILLITFSKSYKSLEIDNIAIVAAIAIDTSNTNKLKLSFQFANPSSISEKGSAQTSPSTIYSVDASSISSAINLVNSYIGKEINLSHCKLIAFSEKLALNGISKEIYSLVNEAQIRPSSNIVVTKCNAKYYLENSTPLSETLLIQYYESFSNSSTYTGYTANATIGDFLENMINTTTQSCAILGGVSNEYTEPETSINSQKDSSGKANESLLSNQIISENSGLAVFKGDKLVGELNTLETLSFLTTVNKVDSFLISVPDPQKTNSYIDLYLTPKIAPFTKVKIINGFPYIKIQYYFTGRIYSMEKDEKLLNSEVLDEISISCNEYLQTVFSTYLYRTSKELKSDINGIGKTAKSQFYTVKDFEQYNWNEKYKDAFFDISVNTKIRSGFLLLET